MLHRSKKTFYVVKVFYLNGLKPRIAGYLFPSKKKARSYVSFETSSHRYIIYKVTVDKFSIVERGFVKHPLHVIVKDLDDFDLPF